MEKGEWRSAMRPNSAVSFLLPSPFSLLLLLFLNQPRPIRHQQFHQILNLRNEFTSFIRILHHHTLRIEFDNQGCRLDVLSFFNGCLLYTSDAADE